MNNSKVDKFLAHPFFKYDMIENIFFVLINDNLASPVSGMLYYDMEI